MEMRSEFGKRLLQARQHAGLTQESVAKQAGISQGTYAELEKKAQGSAYTSQFAQIYGVNTNWLATGSGEMLGKDYRLVAEAGRYELPSVQKPNEPSPSAIELALLFDEIPATDRVRRARAYAAASAAILDVLQEKPSSGA